MGSTVREESRVDPPRLRDTLPKTTWRTHMERREMGKLTTVTTADAPTSTIVTFTTPTLRLSKRRMRGALRSRSHAVLILMTLRFFDLERLRRHHPGDVQTNLPGRPSSFAPPVTSTTTACKHRRLCSSTSASLIRRFRLPTVGVGPVPAVRLVVNKRY